MIPAGTFPEMDEYFKDRLLDFLEKLKIRTAAPKNMDEAIRRATHGTMVSFEDEEDGLNLDELWKRVRSNDS